MPQEKNQNSGEFIVSNNYLISVVKDEFTDDEGKVIPYVQIFTKSDHIDKPLQWKAYHTSLILNNFDKYQKLQGKPVNLVCEIKPSKTGVMLTIKDILPL